MIFGREPALVAGLIESLISLVVAFGLHWTTAQVGLVNAVVAALLGVYTAWATKQTLASGLLALAKSVLSLMIGFGLTLTTEQTAVLVSVVTVAVSMFNRTQNSPATPAERGFRSGVSAPNQPAVNQPGPNLPEPSSAPAAPTRYFVFRTTAVTGTSSAAE